LSLVVTTTTPVDAPPQQNLRGAHRILLCQFLQIGRQESVGGFRDQDQGPVSRDLDVFGLVIGEQVGFLLEVRVEFDLVDCRTDSMFFENDVEVRIEEV